MLQKGKKYVSINTVNKDILFLLLCSITAEQSLCWHPHCLKHALRKRLLVEGDMRTNQFCVFSLQLKNVFWSVGMIVLIFTSV